MEKKALYKTIYHDLLDSIQNNKYPPGSCLPSELKISEVYGVSRITSKKALEMLAEQKLIIRKPGKGSYVLGEGYDETLESEGHGLLDTGEHKLIGVLLDSFGSNFGDEILRGIEKECKQYGFDMILKCSRGNKEEETKAIKRFLEIGVLGMIIMCVHDDTYNDEVLWLSLRKFPAVLVDRKLKGVPLSYVGTDNYKAAKELTEYLFIHGHKNICYVAPKSLDTSTVSDRLRGFVDSHLEHGVITNETTWITDLVSTLPYFGENNLIHQDTEKVKDFMVKNPGITAFFAVEYGIARILYSAMRELGIENEKAMVCFDGISNSNMTPQFAYIEQGQYQIGKNSVKMLAEAMKGKGTLESVLVPYKIVIENK
ncbi:MAG: GntR family transcriptional regulator [Herbinix sp.]|jgi:DNA-binding LacI/PurR family transcriptional regulator|nr:GntR family transcriptional regulator [Herbinix sp.]